MMERVYSHRADVIDVVDETFVGDTNRMCRFAALSVLRMFHLLRRRADRRDGHRQIIPLAPITENRAGN